MSRIQATEQFIRLAHFDEIAPARGLHRCDGSGIRSEWFEWQSFFRSDTNKKQANGI